MGLDQFLRDFGPKYVSDDNNSHVDIDQTQSDGLKLKMDKELKQYALPAYPNVIYSQEELIPCPSFHVDINSPAVTPTSLNGLSKGCRKAIGTLQSNL